MDAFHQMRVFVRIIESGSFTGAANISKTGVGTISRAITDLEARLHTRLLHRTTRRIALTPAGERYLERCRQILSDLEMAEEEASSALEHPQGTLRIHSYASIGQYYILPAISEYRTMYPGVSIKMSFLPLVPDLYEGATDIAVVIASSPLPDSDLVCHFLGSFSNILCASPDYVHAHGLPTVPQELDNHECLILDTPVSPAHDWLLEGPGGSESVKVSGSVEFNVADSVAIAVRSGMGIGTLPIYAARQGIMDGSLIRVLPQYTLSKLNVYALHPYRRYTDARTKTWIQFLRSYLPMVIERDKQSLRDHVNDSELSVNA